MLITEGEKSQEFKLLLPDIFWNKLWIRIKNLPLMCWEKLWQWPSKPQRSERSSVAQCRDSSALNRKNDTNKVGKKTSRIRLIFYCTKVSQGRSESHVNTIPEYRFVSLFYKSRSPESLSDHYYHTNRQIYLTTLFLSHNTYSLVLLHERRWNASTPSSFFSSFFFTGKSSLGW